MLVNVYPQGGRTKLEKSETAFFDVNAVLEH